MVAAPDASTVLVLVNEARNISLVAGTALESSDSIDEYEPLPVLLISDLQQSPQLGLLPDRLTDTHQIWVLKGGFI